MLKIFFLYFPLFRAFRVFRGQYSLRVFAPLRLCVKNCMIQFVNFMELKASKINHYASTKCCCCM